MLCTCSSCSLAHEPPDRQQVQHICKWIITVRSSCLQWHHFYFHPNISSASHLGCTLQLGACPQRGEKLQSGRRQPATRNASMCSGKQCSVGRKSSCKNIDELAYTNVLLCEHCEVAWQCATCSAPQLCAPSWPATSMNTFCACSLVGWQA